MSFDATRIANPVATGLRAYDPGHDLPALRVRFGAALAELGSNENPLGPSPHALAAAHAALGDAHRYPDPRGLALKTALANRLGVAVDRLALGNGSHELLMLLAQAFADARTSVVHSQYGFAVFPIAAAAAGARGTAVPALPRDHATAPLGHDLEAIAASVRDDTRLVYLANPNNPTGTWFDDAALSSFLDRLPHSVLVVVDEAYHDYVDATGLSTALRFADRHPHLVVTRTFSKAYGLAGLRVGYLVAHASVIAVLERLRESFNVNGIALAAATAALGDDAHLAKVRALNAATRGELVAALSARTIATLPTQTNFVLAEFGAHTCEIERRCLDRGVVLRPMGGYGLSHWLRISFGSHEGHERLLEALA